MAFEIKQSLKLSQSLVMTPQLQQAIKLLQLNRQEMQELITNELVENPMLEEIESGGAELSPEGKEERSGLEQREAEGSSAADSMQPDGDNKVVEGDAEFDWEEYVESFTSSPNLPSSREVPSEFTNYDNMISNKSTLREHIAWQVSMSNLMGKELELAEHIVGNLNDEGYFAGDLNEISENLNFNLEDAEEILKLMQCFDPVGVCSRNLGECLTVQLKIRPEDDLSDLLLEIVEKHLSYLKNRDYRSISKATNHPVRVVHEAAKVILQLNPKPGRDYSSGSDVQYITPDIYVYKIGDDYSIALNDDGVPRLKVSSYYGKVLREARAEARHMKGNSKEYIQDKLRSAVWLIKAIHNRQKAIYKVMESIVKYQKDFFEHGVHHLKPMVLREVAADVGMHESTISRVTSNKYAHTPRGTFELKYFFNSGIPSAMGEGVASESIKQRIKDMVAKEDTARPLSDQKIANLLKESDVDIARRTVAKYRESLGILSSSRRKKFF